MPITPDQLTFRRWQSDGGDAVQVFLSLDGTLADGTPTAGPWQSVTVTLTDTELAAAQTIIARAKQALVDQKAS